MLDLLDAVERQNLRTVHQVAETAGSRDEDVAALLELLDVVLERHAAVGADWTEPGAIGDATSEVENLVGQLAGWAHDDDQWFSTDAVNIGVIFRSSGIHTRSTNLVDLAHQLRGNGN